MKGVSGGFVKQHVNKLVRLPCKIAVTAVPDVPVVPEMPEVQETLEASIVSADSPGYTQMPNATQMPEVW